MRIEIVIPLVLFTILSATAGFADEPVLSQEELSKAETETLELDPIEVTGEGFTFEQESMLRVVRSAYEKPRSFRREDMDKWVCWVDDATGSHLSYLYCGRNGDIWALQPDRGIGQRPTGIAGYGNLQISSHPVNKWKLEQALNSLPGNAEFDEEFTAMVMTGERPPRDIPDEEETQQFVSAYRSVNALAAEDAGEDAQIDAIKASGLTLTRYNRIMDLLEIYGSLKNDIGERLKAPATSSDTSGP